VVVAVAVIFTIVSGIDYLVRFRDVLGMGDGGPRSDSSLRQSAAELGDLLREGRLTVSVAESCTGGMLGAAFTDQPGSSAYFVGGVIAYANEVKTAQLGVPSELLSQHGAVSCEVATAMADGVRSRLGSDLAASITCIAGPDADGTSKPVGLTYIGIAGPDGTHCHDYVLGGDRWSNRREAAARAIQLLVDETHRLVPAVKA
jgi:nicotinamide-nucleotide amidase